jgi:hypothetical protein
MIQEVVAGITAQHQVLVAPLARVGSKYRPLKANSRLSITSSHSNATIDEDKEN